MNFIMADFTIIIKPLKLPLGVTLIFCNLYSRNHLKSFAYCANKTHREKIIFNFQWRYKICETCCINCRSIYDEMPWPGIV